MREGILREGRSAGGALQSATKGEGEREEGEGGGWEMRSAEERGGS